MNASALAEMMLRWEKQRRLLDELEEAITEGVMELGKTQTVGNVRASYSAGRKSYDYQAGALSVIVLDTPGSQNLIGRFTSPSVDWRGVCAELERDGEFGPDGIPFRQSGPSVSIKLLG